MNDLLLIFNESPAALGDGAGRAKRVGP
jgi:hypothetical protein